MRFVVSLYDAVLAASTLTDAALLKALESITPPNKLGPAPFETMDEITKKWYLQEQDIDFNMDVWDGYGGARKGTDLFRCHGTCRNLLQVLEISCQHELAQTLVNYYCLGDCHREYPFTIFPNYISEAKRCKLEPQAHATSSQSETESASKPTAVSLPTSTTQVSMATAPQPVTTPSSITVANQSFIITENEASLHYLDSSAVASAIPTYSHPVNDKPDPSRDAFGVQELNGGDQSMLAEAATRMQMRATVTPTVTKTLTTASTTPMMTSSVNLTSGSGKKVVILSVAGADTLTSL